MRKYILTDHERKMITNYLENGIRINGFAVLKHNVGRNMNRIEEDYKLLKRMIDEK